MPRSRKTPRTSTSNPPTNAGAHPPCINANVTSPRTRSVRVSTATRSR
jgi:hypothetical protein